ncbi:B12-binding domain-containing radical SAM protein [Anaeroselena agilis]|uniref:B12-binding domain-containing radical SAM protein n=1 Tax=Anaeroselena agilis TaxID=3063788 RepID=A0ABU3NXC6_9FIRM|nr:B12-binding domain-containing radical SAM protein [Selenomonadales bacterium 4137-cl]
MSVQVLLATLNAKYVHSALALYSLRRYCRQVCPDIAVREYTVNNELLVILGELYREKPDVLGLACYIWNIDATLELAGLVRKVLPATVIVLGGPEVSYDPAGIMETNDAVDYIVQGEGEETLAALLAALAEGRVPRETPGLAFRSDGAVMAGFPQVVRDLKTIPFPYDDDDMAGLRGRIVYYESSRGCPYSCQYCLSSATAGVRFLPVERVLDELAFFIAQGVKQIKFVDRTFNARREHYLPIIEFLAAQDTSTNFHLEIAADLLDDDVLAVLKTAPPGRFQLEIGVQSTNEDTLTAITRRNDWPRIVANVGSLRAAGNIHLHLDLIAGLPYEDYRRFGQSFNDVYSLKPHMLQLGFLKLLKGSGMRRTADDHGYAFMDCAPYEVLANKYISYGEIRKLKIFEEMFNQLYNSGRFPATLDWFVATSGGAFALYEAIAAYWEKHDLHLIAPGARGLARHLDGFCREAFPEQTAICRQFLKFDTLGSDRDSGRPDFLPWDGADREEAKSAFWRDEAAVRRYLPGYVFTSWREVRNNHHIEFFDIDIPAWLDDGWFVKRPTAVLFTRSRGTPSWQKVEPGDLLKGRAV